MLDVADNLQRAMESVPADVLAESGALDVEKAVKLLKGLQEGVQLTNGVLLQVGAPPLHQPPAAAAG